MDWVENASPPARIIVPGGINVWMGEKVVSDNPCPGGPLWLDSAKESADGERGLGHLLNADTLSRKMLEPGRLRPFGWRDYIPAALDHMAYAGFGLVVHALIDASLCKVRYADVPDDQDHVSVHRHDAPSSKISEMPIVQDPTVHAGFFSMSALPTKKALSSAFSILIDFMLVFATVLLR